MAWGSLTAGWNAPERRDGVRLLALQRVLAVPVFLFVGLEQPDVDSGAAVRLAVVMFVLLLAQVPFLLGPGWQRVPLPLLLVIDVEAMVAAIGITGGGDSDLRFLTALMMFTPALCFPRRLLVALFALLIVSAAAPALLNDTDNALITIATFALAGVLITSAAEINDRLLTELERRADERRTVLARALDAEGQRRRLLAQDIHDRSLQTLLAARQDLMEGMDGDLGALQLARRQLDLATGALRDAVHDLHPGALTGTRLPQALQALAARTRVDGRLRVELEVVDGPGGEHEELLYALAREAVVNAVRHADATRLQIVLRPDGQEAVVLEICDDGRSRVSTDMTGDVDAGRTGLAAYVERVAEAGGQLELDADPSTGTCIRARVPVGAWTTSS